MQGEEIYEYDLSITGATDFGVTQPSIPSGLSRVPPQGARIDVAFEGRAKGRLTGASERRFSTASIAHGHPAFLKLCRCTRISLPSGA